ncbi:MAG: hypothetical protein M3R15_02300, partial [Acidobacteriota bacterium]|nr:hypothetical protein [Acidobacteriota bacterium]
MRAQRPQAFVRIALVSLASVIVFAASTPAPVTFAQQSTTKQQEPSAPNTTLSPTNRPVAPGASGETGDRPVIINTDLITLTVTVTDMYGRFVTGLNKNAFTVLDEKEQQEISFFSDEDAPVSLGVIFDVSGSMNGEKIQRA